MTTKTLQPSYLVRKAWEDFWYNRRHRYVEGLPADQQKRCDFVADCVTKLLAEFDTTTSMEETEMKRWFDSMDAVKRGEMTASFRAIIEKRPTDSDKAILEQPGSLPNPEEIQSLLMQHQPKKEPEYPAWSMNMITGVRYAIDAGTFFYVGILDSATVDYLVLRSVEAIPTKWTFAQVVQHDYHNSEQPRVLTHPLTIRRDQVRMHAPQDRKVKPGV